jgi:hypothetical protein
MAWSTPRGRTTAYVEAKTTEEGLKLLKAGAKRAKWGNIRTEYPVGSGAWYDSQGEATLAQRLDLLQQAGLIHAWQRGTPWVLLEEPDGVTYIPDFEVWVTPDDFRLLDFKGALTDVFRLKAKFFKRYYSHVPLWIVKADGTEELA